MNKVEFVLELSRRLACLPAEELEERLDFYAEMIDDRMDEGLTEEEAVAQVGSVEAIAAQILADSPLSKRIRHSLPAGRQMRAWEIWLLILGAPVWLPLLLAVFAVALSLYAALWAVLISLWAVWAALAVCVPAGLLAGAVYVCSGSGVTGMALLAAVMVCAGLAVFLFYGCKAACRGAWQLIPQTAAWIGRRRKGKECA